MQSPGVDPIIGPAERMLAPAWIIVGGKTGALEVIEPLHGQHQPVFALLYQAIQQSHIIDFVRLKAAHRIKLRRRGLEECFLFIVFFKSSA
jgi:hypothetical protein